MDVWNTIHIVDSAFKILEWLAWFGHIQVGVLWSQQKILW